MCPDDWIHLVWLHDFIMTPGSVLGTRLEDRGRTLCTKEVQPCNPAAQRPSKKLCMLNVPLSSLRTDYANLNQNLRTKPLLRSILVLQIDNLRFVPFKVFWPICPSRNNGQIRCPGVFYSWNEPPDLLAPPFARKKG